MTRRKRTLDARAWGRHIAGSDSSSATRASTSPSAAGSGSGTSSSWVPPSPGPFNGSSVEQTPQRGERRVWLVVVPGAGGAIQVGSAHSAKSATVRAAGRGQRDDEEDGIQKHRFEVGDVAVERVAIGIIGHPEGFEDV